MAEQPQLAEAEKLLVFHKPSRTGQVSRPSLCIYRAACLRLGDWARYGAWMGAITDMQSPGLTRPRRLTRALGWAQGGKPGMRRQALLGMKNPDHRVAGV